MMQQIYFSRFIRSLKRKKFWFMSLLCIIFLIIILVHYYESFRRYAKKMQNELKEAEIRELYILAKNNNDIYHLTNKLIQPDTYNMTNIRPYWDLVGFMFRVPYLMFHYTPNIRSGYITTNDLGYRGEINFFTSLQYR
jgi:hypothetical protein